MATWHKRVAPAMATMSLMLGTATVATAVSAAEEAILIPGATVFKPINPLYPVVAQTYPVIGIHFHDDDDPHLVDYSQNALAADKAIRDGVEQAVIAVRETPDGPVVVIGESMGSMVASRVAVELAGSDGSSTDDIRIVLIAPPEAGVAEYFREGTFIPILNYRISRVPESPYPTTIVIGEYDGWADPPDRPWNLVSLANAVAGMAFVHGPPIAAADPLDVPLENTTHTTNSLGGEVTTHLVPTEDLPLTQAFRLVGIPDQVMGKVDQILRPVVDAGYLRHDKPGDHRPYLSDGEIHLDVAGVQQVRERWPERRREIRADLARWADNRGELRQRIRGDRLDKVEGSLRRLKQKAEEKAERWGERTSDAGGGLSSASPTSAGTTLHSLGSSAKKAVGTRDR